MWGITQQPAADRQSVSPSLADDCLTGAPNEQAEKILFHMTTCPIIVPYHPGASSPSPRHSDDHDQIPDAIRSLATTAATTAATATSAATATATATGLSITHRSPTSPGRRRWRYLSSKFRPLGSGRRRRMVSVEPPAVGWVGPSSTDWKTAGFGGPQTPEWTCQPTFLTLVT